MPSLQKQTQPAKTHRILIVDDEPAMLFAYRRLIEREGIIVDVSESLEHAVTLLRTHSYFAVISDIRLAGSGNTDGLTVLKNIRSEWPETKMILMTGYGNSDIVHSAGDLGVAHYFEKPVSPFVILELLTRFSNEATST